LVDPTFLPASRPVFEQDPLSNRACGFPAHGLPVVCRDAALRGLWVANGSAQAHESVTLEEVARPALGFPRA
jgi:hypothetical protein